MSLVVEVIVIAHHGEVGPGAYYEPEAEFQRLVIDQRKPGYDRIIGDTARLLAQKAVHGRLDPTPRRDGGRG